MASMTRDNKSNPLSLLNRPAHELAVSVQVVQRAFLNKWGLSTVDPKFTLKELVSYTPSSFVTIHRMCRGDSIQSLAVRYSTTTVEIKMYNNLLSEHALPAHARVYVPLLDPQALCGKHLKRVVTDGMRRVLPVRLPTSSCALTARDHLLHPEALYGICSTENSQDLCPYLGGSFAACAAMGQHVQACDSALLTGEVVVGGV